MKLAQGMMIMLNQQKGQQNQRQGEPQDGGGDSKSHIGNRTTVGFYAVGIIQNF
jgi:hypothetical protein